MPNETRNIVFAVERRKDKDLTPASKYGHIVYLVEERRAGEKQLTPGIINDMASKLKKFRNGDYLLLVGDPCLIGAATTLAAKFNNGGVAFLRWERRMQGYTVERMQL